MLTVNSVVMASSSLTDWIDGMIADARGLITAVLVVVGVVVAILIIVKNPTVGRVITGVVVGAFVSGLPWIIPAVGEMFRGDIQASGHYMIIENHVQALGSLSWKTTPEL